MAGDPTLAHRRAEIRRRGIMTAMLIAVLVVVLRSVPLTSGFFVFPLIESLAYDLACEQQAPAPPADIVIVAIDDTSLQPQHQGRWPWSRRVHARLLRRLSEARVVAFDVIFAEPEPDADAEFAQAIAEAANVVLASYHAVEMECSAGRAPRLGLPAPVRSAAVDGGADRKSHASGRAAGERGGRHRLRGHRPRRRRRLTSPPAPTTS